MLVQDRFIAIQTIEKEVAAAKKALKTRRIALLKSQIESAKSAVAMLKNSRDVAQEATREIGNALSYTRLVSPIDGTVSTIYALLRCE